MDVGAITTLASESWATETGGGGDIGGGGTPAVAPPAFTAPPPTDDWSAEAEQWSEQVEGEWGATTNWST